MGAVSGIPLTDPPERLGETDGPLHIVLVEPLIPQNSGNVARLCAALDAWMHLVEPLGYDLDHRKLKRAGLDYWPNVRLSVYAGWEELAARLNREEAFFFSKKAERLYTEVSYPASSVLIFGKETLGLGGELLARYADRLVRIPTTDKVRSINLANAVAVGAYEVVRQQGGLRG